MWNKKLIDSLIKALSIVLLYCDSWTSMAIALYNGKFRHIRSKKNNNLVDPLTKRLSRDSINSTSRVMGFKEFLKYHS